MAVEISNGTTVPHATDYEDLLDKLKTFALANGWTSLEDTSDKLVLQGEGSGTDEIIVAIQKYDNVGTDSYGWRLNGYAGYQSGHVFLTQPGAIQPSDANTYGVISLPLWNSTIPYWFIVSGRRIIVVAKVSTTYQMAYLGFFLPFASPNQYPYPLCVGGSHRGQSATETPRWSGTSAQSSAFWTSGSDASGVNTLLTRTPAGAWLSQYNSHDSTLQTATGIYPYNQGDITQMRQALDDSAVLTRLEIQHNQTSPVSHNRLGELDGLFHVSGFAQSAEDIITIDAEDYLVVPNVYRSSAADYVAVKLA